MHLNSLSCSYHFASKKPDLTRPSRLRGRGLFSLPPPMCMEYPPHPVEVVFQRNCLMKFRLVRRNARCHATNCLMVQGSNQDVCGSKYPYIKVAPTSKRPVKIPGWRARELSSHEIFKSSIRTEAAGVRALSLPRAVPACEPRQRPRPPHRSFSFENICLLARSRVLAAHSASPAQYITVTSGFRIKVKSPDEASSI